ncbi:MAG: substrate-binding periplasmic protein [Rhodoferax sp.]
MQRRDCLWTLALLATPPLRAAEPILVGVDSNNPPFMYAESGQAAGLYPVLLKALFAEAGLPLKLEAKPWKRCLQDTDEGRAGTGGIYKNDERLRKYDFSEALFVERMAVYHHRNRPVVFDGLGALMGKRVGVARGWSYGDAFDKAAREGQIHAEEVSADTQNFQKLAAGRLDAVLAIDEAGSAQLAQPGMQDIAKSARYLFENPTYLAFAKAAQQAATLAAINRALEALRRQGRLQTLAAQALG